MKLPNKHTNNRNFDVPCNDIIACFLGGFKNATDLRKTNSGLKVLIAIGGWNEGVKKYSDMVSDGTTRKKFVDSVVAFVDKHDFDGLDLDWEYPGDTERGGKHSDR